jgi:hypothetical protein
MKDTAMPRFPARIAGTRNTLGGIRINRRWLAYFRRPQSPPDISVSQICPEFEYCVRIARKNVCGIRLMLSWAMQYLPEYVLSGASQNSSSRECGIRKSASTRNLLCPF